MGPKSNKSKDKDQIPVDDIISAITSESLVEEQLIKVQGILKELVSNNPDIQGVIVVSIEGFPIASYPEEAFSEEAKVAAAIAAIFATSERNALDLVREHVNYVAIRTFNRYILIRLALEDYIIAVITSEKAKLGILIRDIIGASEKLKKILSI